MSLSEAALGGAGYPQAAIRRPAGGSARRAGAGLGGIDAVFDAERGRLFLWLPVLFGCGIALYLGAPSEPSLALAAGAATCALALRMVFRTTTLRLIVSSAALLIAAGFLCAKLYALAAAAPALDRDVRFAELQGWVERVEEQEKRVRLTIRLISLERVPVDEMPRRVRISQRGKAAPPAPGDAIRTKATLMPPPEPAMPGGFDFGRYYWFQGIGASGYVTGKIEPMATPPPIPLDLWLRAGIANMRHAIAARIGAVLQGDTGAIAKALIMGARGEISEPANVALRDSGLVHVISISGFHMALTAGSMFWLIRAVLALFPALALRFPIKIWAAVGALVIATLYLAISGGAVTALRAYIMVAIIFTAIILNRPAISLRNLAIAALVILIAMPQSLLDAGFQMSFAATAALIAYYEARPPLGRLSAWPVYVAMPVMFLFDAATTTLVASAAVDPFAAYHFHRIAVYSVLGNIFAMPVVSFVVMPMALLALVAMPFGLETAPLLVMEQGIAAMLAVSVFVSSLPGAALAVPAFAEGAFTLMIAGGLWLIIWRGRWRYMGLAAIGAGLALAPFGERPDVWIERAGKLVAIRDAEGNIATTESRKATFSLERWMEADGDARPVKAARSKTTFQCDGQSCIALVKGKLVSHVLHPAALADDCRRAAILIVTFRLPERCTQPEIVIDLDDLREKGAHTLRIVEDSIVARTVAEERGRRPWSIWTPRRATIPAVAPDQPADADGGGSDSDANDAGQ